MLTEKWTSETEDLMIVLDDERKLAIARAYGQASRANDAAALGAMSAPGAVTWHNFDEAEVTIEQMAKSLGWLHRTVEGLAWDDVAVKATSDGFLWQSVLTGATVGGPLRCQSCVIVTLDDDGRVVRTDEYLDSAQTAVLVR